MTREDFILTAKERGYTLEETKSAMERFRADGNIFDDERAVSVEDNFSDLSIDEEALQNTSDPKKQSIIGKVAGYLSSSAKQDFDHIYGNVEQYVKSFIGNKDATVESAYSDIQTNVLDIKSIDSTDNIVSLIVDDALGDRAKSYKQIPVTELKDIEVPEQVEQVADQELVKINPEDFNIPSQSTPLTVTANISMDEPLVEDFYIAPMGAYGEMDEERFRQLKAKLPYGLGELDLENKKIDIVRQLQAEEAFLALPEEEQAKAYMLEMTANPAMQLNVGIVETVLPDWLQPFDVFGVEISDPKTTTQSLARASGNITGFITSMVTANKFLQGAGGVRAIPYVRTVLNNITKTSPKSAMYVERSLNTFAAFTLRNQAFVDPTTPIEERTKMLKEDALYSIAFPAADIMSQMRGGLAVGTTTIFAVGFNSGEGTTSEKTINGASLTLMWLLSQGLSYKSGKAQLKEFLKQSGLERNVLKPNGTSANDFINSLNRAEVMKASSNLNALIYKNKYINSEAVSIYSKPKPNSADSVVMSAANESSAVGLAKQGALPPIQGDRSVKLLNQAVAVAKKQPVTEPTPVAEPVPSEATQAKLFESDPQMKLAEQQKLIQQYNDPRELAYQLSLVPEVSAEIVMQESERLLPELYENAKLADETEMPVVVWNDKAINSTRKTIETFTNVFRKFGRAYVSDRKLLKKLDESFAQISAAPLKGISDINSAFEKFPATSKSDRVAVTLAFEAGTRDALEPRLQPIYDMVESASRSLEQSLIDSGILKKSFAELRQQRIDDLVAELGTKVSPKRSEEIRKELDYLRDVQKYLSHSIVSQRVFEVKSKEPNKKLRQKFQGSLKDFHQTRKGLFSLGQYYESGLLKESDLDVVKILMSTYADGYQKLAVRSLVDWGMASNYIVPKNQPLTYPDNYISGSETQYSNRIADIENYNVHRLFDDGLLEIMGYNSKPTNVWEKMAGMVKVGQFFNPFIIYKYNAQQALYGQTFTIKPKVWGKAFNAVKNKNELFLQLDEAGLYQRIDIPIKRELDKQIAYYSRKTLNKNKEYYQEQMTAIVQDVLNLTPKQAIEFVKDKGFETIKNVILTPHTVTAQMTWFGDEVQRTASALKLINDGMDLKEAAQIAARTHGGYTNVGTPYRQFGRNVFFVYSFRLLMPKKFLIDPVIGVTKDIYNRVTGKKIDKRKARMLYMGLATTTGLHYAQEVYLKSQGWEEAPEERESGFRKLTDKFTLKIGNTKFRFLLPTYKYVKNVDMPDGTTKQIVLPKTDIMTMVPKVLVRATSPKSGDVDLLGQRVWDALKFEITPLFNIGKAFALNEPYYGELPPRGLDGTDIVGGLGWMFKKTFVGWDAGKQAELLGLTKDEDNDRVLKENLNAIEKTMAWFASEYIRSLPEDRATSELYKLRGQSKQLARTIQNADNISEKEKEMLMEELVEVIEERIDAIKIISK